MLEDRLERVRTRLNASPELEEAVRRAVADGRVPAAAAAVIPPEDAEAAGRNRERLERIVPSDALEAIVQRIGRPPLLVRNDTVELEPLVDFPPGTDTLVKKIEPDVKSVGRVEFLNHSMAWGGTGWVIGEDGAQRVVATNRHVAKLVARRSADGRGVFLRSPLSGVRYGMNLDFKEEAGSLPADARPVSVTERREDPNWDPASGPADGSALAEQANEDTFHYTNAAPQHSTMNQGKQLWQGLENYILDSARTRGFRACVFTGPIARPDDPEIKPGVQAPREFWKLVAMIDADRDALHATAYLLSQGDLIRDLLEKRERTEAVEGFVLGAHRTFQLAIRDLADATGFDFSAYLAADPLGRTDPGREAAADAAPLFVPLESLADVVA
jgi:DNA/RNA non-specific endonuclease